MADTYEYTDALGGEWAFTFIPGTTGKKPAWQGALRRAAYGTEPGAVVLRAESMEVLKTEAEDYAADFYKGNGASPQLQVSANNRGLWMLVAVGALLWYADKRR